MSVNAAGAKKICFVAPKAYWPLVGCTNPDHIGGAEVQQCHLARALGKQGYEVSMLVNDYGQADNYVHDGVCLVKIGPSIGNQRGLRLKTWPGRKIAHLWSAMKRADADIYYQRAAGFETGLAAAWCRLHQRRFIFSVASDSNCCVELSDLKTLREKSLYLFGLRSADCVITQTIEQYMLLRENFGVASEIVRSCAVDPFPSSEAERDRSTSDRPHVLWVGRIAQKKRFEWLMALASSCPDVLFDVVGEGRPDDAYAADLLAGAARATNIRLHGRVPPNDMNRFYDKARVLLNTSLVEGFPNVFVEAWARGIPTVATVDPDNIISHNRLGGVGRTVEQLRDVILKLVTNSGEWTECSQRARTIFLKEHTVDKVLAHMVRLLQSLYTNKSVSLPNPQFAPEHRS